MKRSKVKITRSTLTRHIFSINLSSFTFHLTVVTLVPLRLQVCYITAMVKRQEGVVPPEPPPRRAPPALIAREDSFDRPDSPLFHETLPLPVESSIRRHRQRSRGRQAGERSGSSSESDGPGVGVDERGTSRRQRRQQRHERRRRAASAGAKSRHTQPTAHTGLVLMIQFKTH